MLIGPVSRIRRKYLSRISNSTLYLLHKYVWLYLDLIVQITRFQDIGSYKPNLNNFEYMLKAAKDTFNIEKHEVSNDLLLEDITGSD